MKLIPGQFLKGSATMAFSALAVGLSGYLSRRLMANGLPENDYAFFYGTMALQSLLLLVIHCGTADVLLFELPGMLLKKQRRRAAYTYRYVCKFQQILSFVVFVVLFLATPLLKKYYFDYPVNNVLLWIFFLLLWGYSLENTVLYTLNSLKKFMSASLLRACKSTFFAIAVLLALFTPEPLLIIILSMVLITTLCSLAGKMIIHKSLISSTRIPRSIRSFVFKSGITFALLNVGFILMQDFGTFALSLFSSVREVVLFNIALPISMIVLSFNVVMQVFTPMIANFYHAGEMLRLKRWFGILSVLIILVVVLAFPILYWGGALIIKMLFSAKFTDAHWCMIFMVESAILSLLIRAFSSFFNTIGQRNISIKTLIPTSITAVISYPLLAWYGGATGTGIATLFSTLVWLSACFFYYKSIVTGRTGNETKYG